ncbi:stage V sporulation protein AA [Pontibacillus litoralis]|uniref:Stage V sporulation protein AA n=1 Tax=Pontibacillus litoralis JSM 072002 TaxID=1385512 RepID=A0A0A5HQT7_9BACI|nr:stage V sporulation protein AA [Pontibacillus litoralis]KGX85977.1 stage V sporulation protein AA [Pontibacillus litoralis JSM 072002]
MSVMVYIRLKQKIQSQRNQTIYLRDIAYIEAPKECKQELEQVPLYTVRESDRNIVIVDIFRVIYVLRQHYAQLEIQPLGPEQTIVTIPNLKQSPSYIAVGVIWILLFIGAAMAIMNFHYDVSMEEVQQRVHYLLTGEKVEHPLWFQIPYSLGLGVGMMLFFNHFFKKRINEEPSPLEIEMYKYQLDLDEYVVYHENEVSKESMHHDSSIP